MVTESASSGAYEGNFHGERIVDGDATTATALLLYKSGTNTAFTLDSRYKLVITDILIVCETGGDIALLANGAVAGEYIFEGTVAATFVMDRHLIIPYVCQAGEVPTFKGIQTGKSNCIVEGYIITR